MIQDKINNVRDKVDLLTLYGPKFLKECKKNNIPAVSNSHFSSMIVDTMIDTTDKQEFHRGSITTEDILHVGEQIIEAIIVFTENNGKFTGSFSHLELKPGQSVLLENVLQIFFRDFDPDNIFLTLIERIVEKFAGTRYEALT